MYHHRLGELGVVQKTGTELFVPLGVTKTRNGMILPEAMRINVLSDELKDISLEGWQHLESKIYGIFGLKRERIVEPVVRNVRKEIMQEQA